MIYKLFMIKSILEFLLKHSLEINSCTLCGVIWTLRNDVIHDDESVINILMKI